MLNQIPSFGYRAKYLASFYAILKSMRLAKGLSIATFVTLLPFLIILGCKPMGPTDCETPCPDGRNCARNGDCSECPTTIENCKPNNVCTQYRPYCPKCVGDGSFCPKGNCQECRCPQCLQADCRRCPPPSSNSISQQFNVSTNAIRQQFNVSTESTIRLVRGTDQLVLRIRSGLMEVVNQTILENVTLPLGDVTLGGLTLQNVAIRNTDIALLNFQLGTGGNIAFIPGGSVPFNLSFNFGGKFIQQIILPSDITVLASNNSLQLSGQADVQLDPNNPLLPEFSSLGMFFPFTVSFQVTATLETNPPPVKCNTICFRTPQDWLLSFNPLPRSPVLIGGINFNTPTRDIQAIRSALQGNVFGFGNLTPLQQLNQQFVAAQLSLNFAGGGPVTANVLWANLSCYGGRLALFAPATLSNGFTFTPNSMLKDLFMQAEFAIRENRTTDMLALARFFALLNSTCR